MSELKVMYKQFMVLGFETDTTNDDTIVDTVADTMALFNWMFEDAAWHDIQVQVMSVVDGKNVSKRFAEYRFDQGMEGLHQYLNLISCYIFNKIPLGLDSCDIELRVFGTNPLHTMKASSQAVKNIAEKIHKHRTDGLSPEEYGPMIETTVQREAKAILDES